MLFVSGSTKEDFCADSMKQSAVIMQLMVIGEVAKKIEEPVRSEIPVPWKLIIGLRNVIAHDYFSVEVESVWDIATNNVPELERKLHEYLAAHNTAYLPPDADTRPLME